MPPDTTQANPAGDEIPITTVTMDDDSGSMSSSEQFLEGHRLCIICSNYKLKEAFPEKFTDKCDHSPTVCIADTERWIESQFSWRTWDAMACPQCGVVLQRDDIKRLAVPAVFQKCVRDRLNPISLFVSSFSLKPHLSSPNPH